MTRMHQVKALWKVRTAELEAVVVLRKIRENGGYVLVDIDGGPMLFEFTEPERNTMRRALELYVSELRGEIVKTEKHEWRQALREEKTILEGVVEQLSV